MAATETKLGEIRVGDRVRVDWTGATYNTYVDMATLMGLGKWTRGNTPRKYTEGVVVAVKRHENDCVDVVAFLAPDGKEYMVGNDGLTVIEKGVTDPATHLKALIEELEELREFKRRVLEAVE